ncbi:unnamed protein product [Cyprideis torosa]|uniref:Uncharacterized protein n=1 Tax=Cyprideis torosa TaxID=163714 RepID=A0A7R8WNL5_9CRUS|nr:unnamed protein product [Cyprideis torosa]CAG0906446.1 unnamed protein product [Cyprideis torosa]
MERRQRLFELVADVAVQEKARLVVPEEAPQGVRRSKRKRAVFVNALAGDKVIRKWVTSENGTFLETVGVERGNFHCWDMRFMRAYTDGNLKAQKLLAPMKRIHKDSWPAFDNEDLEDHVSIPTTGNDGVEREIPRFFPFRSAPFVCGNGEPADEDTPFTQNILLETDEFQVGWMRLLAGAKKERTLVQRGCMIFLVHRGTLLVNLKGMEDRDEEEFFEVCEGTMFTVPARKLRCPGRS